jgi:hypothetical protein
MDIHNNFVKTLIPGFNGERNNMDIHNNFVKTLIPGFNGEVHHLWYNSFIT